MLNISFVKKIVRCRFGSFKSGFEETDDCVLFQLIVIFQYSSISSMGC